MRPRIYCLLLHFSVFDWSVNNAVEPNKKTQNTKSLLGKHMLNIPIEYYSLVGRQFLQILGHALQVFYFLFWVNYGSCTGQAFTTYSIMTNYLYPV